MDKAMKDALIERAWIAGNRRAGYHDQAIDPRWNRDIAEAALEATGVFDLVEALERKRRMVIQDFDEQQKADEAIAAALTRMKGQDNDPA